MLIYLVSSTYIICKRNNHFTNTKGMCITNKYYFSNEIKFIKHYTTNYYNNSKCSIEIKIILVK